MRSIRKLRSNLYQKIKLKKGSKFFMPSVWIDNSKEPRQIYPYVLEILDYILEKNREKDVDFSKPYYSKVSGGEAGFWIKNAFIYSMMIRFSSAYDYDNDGSLNSSDYKLKETGTFLRSIALLPYLRSMGIDTVYILPIMKHSFRYKKGSAGSCYAVSNFFKLDPELGDPIMGSDSSVELEFKAFVESAHAFGIKIIIDIIPRTNAINSDMIEEHPDWFYWIKIKDLENYKSPEVPNIKKPSTATEAILKDVFDSDEVTYHIMKFMKNPREENPKLYETCKDKYAASKANYPDFLSVIEAEFGLTVAPAFSDVVNDKQPPWNDITYLRLFLDHPRESSKILSKKKLKPNPYLLFDVAKASNCPGKVPNKELWETLSDIIPHYQKNYGVDGVRIDMGHALPKELLDLIIKKTKNIDKNFCLVAEELNPKMAPISKNLGYHALIGDGFNKLNDLENRGYFKFAKTAYNQPIPVLASSETHDTPRIASKRFGKTRARMITAASLFIPNTIAFLNSGQELFEIQPMNLGLGASSKDQFVLDKNDPYYGRLALFDYTALHWDKAQKYNMIEDIGFLAKYRKAYLNSSKIENAFYRVNGKNNMGAVHSYIKKDSCLIAAVNTDLRKGGYITLEKKVLPKIFWDSLASKCVYSTKKKTRLIALHRVKNGIMFKLSAGEFALFEFKIK